MRLKKSQKSLKDWGSQKWMTSGTHANKKRGKSKEVKSKGKGRYLPKAAWDSLSSGEKAATIKPRPAATSSSSLSLKRSRKRPPDSGNKLLLYLHSYN